jgi:transglutaminase-like putative cysteine protease
MLLLAGTLLVSLTGLHVALTGSSWWIVATVFLLLVLITTTLVRQLTRPVWLPTAAGALVGLLALTVGYGADTALLGIIPSPETVTRLAQLTNDAWGEIAVQSLPASPELSIVFLIAISCIGLALLGDLALRIAPALTALPILILLVIPVAVRPDIAEPYWYVLAAIGYLALLRIGRRRATGATMIVLGAMVIVGSFVVSGIFPPVEQSPDQVTSGGVSTGINPLINLGDDLRRGAPVTAVSYTTSNNQAVYLRLATLDTFDGRSWTPTLIGPKAKNSLSAFPAPVGLTTAVKRSKQTAAVTVGGIQGNWLPVPYPTTKVTGATGTWFWEAEGLSVRSTDTSVGGQTYSASFLDVQPDLAQLRSSSTNQTVSKSYLGLPARLPSIISQTAKSVAASATTDYDRALALQAYFRSDLFTYSTTAPVAQGYDGTGADVVAEFLQKKAGYCVHFASAMAIMARVLGIPSRVAVGFQPGQPTVKNGQTVFTVSTHDLHAWPELYFQGIGWLRFEPTPGRGDLPSYSDPAAVAQLPTDSPTDASTTAPTATANPSAAAGRDLPTDQANNSGGSAAGGFNAAPLVLLILLALLLAVGLAPAVGRLLVRWRRERAIARGRDPATNAWAEVRDTARDHGWLAPETETAREFAARLSMVLADDSDRIAGFRGNVESAAYGPPDAASLSLPELRAVRRAIARSVSPRERLRAVFLPASLLARVRFDPDA